MTTSLLVMLSRNRTEVDLWQGEKATERRGGGIFMWDFTLEIEATQLPHQLRHHPAAGNKLLSDLPGRSHIYLEGLHPCSHFRSDCFSLRVHLFIHWSDVNVLFLDNNNGNKLNLFCTFLTMVLKCTDKHWTYHNNNSTALIGQKILSINANAEYKNKIGPNAAIKAFFENEKWDFISKPTKLDFFHQQVYKNLRAQGCN